jgi:hypothetical protein
MRYPANRGRLLSVGRPRKDPKGELAETLAVSVPRLDALFLKIVALERALRKIGYPPGGPPPGFRWNVSELVREMITTERKKRTWEGFWYHVVGRDLETGRLEYEWRNEETGETRFSSVAEGDRPQLPPPEARVDGQDVRRLLHPWEQPKKRKRARA